MFRFSLSDNLLQLTAVRNTLCRKKKFLPIFISSAHWLRLVFKTTKFHVIYLVRTFKNIPSVRFYKRDEVDSFNQNRSSLWKIPQIFNLSPSSEVASVKAHEPQKSKAGTPYFCKFNALRKQNNDKIEL